MLRKFRFTSTCVYDLIPNCREDISDDEFHLFSNLTRKGIGPKRCTADVFVESRVATYMPKLWTRSKWQ